MRLQGKYFNRKVAKDKKLGIELSGVSLPAPSFPLGIINWSVNQLPMTMMMKWSQNWWWWCWWRWWSWWWCCCWWRWWCCCLWWWWWWYTGDDLEWLVYQKILPLECQNNILVVIKNMQSIFRLGSKLQSVDFADLDWDRCPMIINYDDNHGYILRCSELTMLIIMVTAINILRQPSSSDATQTFHFSALFVFTPALNNNAGPVFLLF